MLSSKHCKELDVFKNINGNGETSDSRSDKNNTSKNKESSVVKFVDLNALFYVLHQRSELDPVGIAIKSEIYPYSDFLNQVQIYLKFAQGTNVKKLVKKYDLQKLSASIDELFVPIIIVENLNRETEEKFTFISEIILNNNASLVIDIENNPFEISFRDLTKILLMQKYTKCLMECLAILNDTLDILLGNSNSDTDRSMELSSIEEGLRKLIIYEEQYAGYDKFLSIKRALWLTKNVILDGYKQNILNFLVNILKQNPNPIILKDLPETMSADEIKKHYQKFCRTIKNLRADVSVMKTKKDESTYNIFKQIEDALDILEYQNSYTYLKELDCIENVLRILEPVNISDMAIHLKIAHERAASSCKENIISTLAELYAALDDLDKWIKFNLDVDAIVKINIFDYKNCDVLRKMKSKIAGKLEVKKSKEFLDDSGSKVPVYKMRCKYRGTCLIINNIDFKSNASTRHGATTDEANLENIFKQVNFNVFTYRNCSKQDLFEQLQHIKKFDSDCLFVIVMSHGNEGTAVESSIIEMHDGDIVKVSDILDLFTFDQYQFPDKPKIFMFQICRGERCNIAKHVKKDEDHSNVVTVDLVPNVSNMLLAFSTPPGYLSKRHHMSGALYITEFCDVFRRHAHDTHLEDMLIIVDHNIKGRRAIDDPMQTCCFENRGFKHCYFHPGLYEH